jgi:hypothetical protein
LWLIFDSEGIHQAIYIVAEHTIIFLSEEMSTADDDCELKKFGHFSREGSIVKISIPVTLLCLWTAPDREQDRSVHPM